MKWLQSTPLCNNTNKAFRELKAIASWHVSNCFRKRFRIEKITKPLKLIWQMARGIKNDFPPFATVL
jgi:hypothetical protein